MSWPSFTVTTPRATERLAFEADSGRVGRSSDCKIVIRGDPTVSSHHLDIVLQDEQWFMISRVPFGRTRHNGRQITPDEPTFLKDGDVVEIGDGTQLVFHAPVRRSVRKVVPLPDVPTSIIPPIRHFKETEEQQAEPQSEASRADRRDVPKRVAIPTPEKRPVSEAEGLPERPPQDPHGDVGTKQRPQVPVVPASSVEEKKAAELPIFVVTPSRRPPPSEVDGDDLTLGHDEGVFTFPDINDSPLAPPPPPPPPEPPQSSIPEGAMDPSGRLIELLPPPLQEDEFLQRFLLIFEGVWDSIERRQDHIELMFDIESAPVEFGRWLRSWLAKRRADGEELRAFGTDGAHGEPGS